MNEERFLISFDADASKFDKEVNKVQNKLNNMTDTVIIDFEANEANQSLKRATAAMNSFKNTSKQTKRETTEIGDYFNKLAKNINNSVKNSAKLRGTLSKLSTVKSKLDNAEFKGYNIKDTLNSARGKVKKAYDNNKTLKMEKYFRKGIAPLKEFPFFSRQSWNLSKNVGIGFAKLFNLPKLESHYQKQKNGIVEDILPSEALKKFQGMAKAMTYAPITEQILGSLVDNRARAGILNKVFIAAKDGLAEYNKQLEIAKANINKIKNDRKTVWYDESEGISKKGDLEDYKKYLETRKKLANANKPSDASMKMFNLASHGEDAINTEIAKVSSELEKLNEKRRKGLERGTLDKDSEKYTEIIEKIKEYKRQLFELKSLKANNGQFYETADTDIQDLRYNAKGSGNYVNMSNLDIKVKESEELDKEYEKVTKEIEKTNNQLLIFLTIAKNCKNEIRAIVLDLQKNPLKEGWSSNTLKRFTKMWKDMMARFSKDNPATKLQTAFTRLGSRMKQQTTSIFANWLNPIYIMQRGMSAFFSQNIKYANTFKVVMYNAVSLIDKAMKTFANWILAGLQYVNILTKKWYGIDLFDKSAASAKKMKNELKDVTASFDELHAVGGSDINFGTTLMDTGELPDLNPKIKKFFEDVAERGKDVGTKFGNYFVEFFKHPIRNFLAGWAILEGTKLFMTLFGSTLFNIAKSAFKQLFSWIGLGLKTVFSSPTIFSAINSGSIGFATILRTIGGAILTITGLWNSFKAGLALGKNWNELTTFQKILGGIKIAINSVVTGLGVFMLTGNPLLAVIATVSSALISLGAAFMSSHTGIESLKKETEKYAEAVEKARQSEQDWQDSMITLRELEEQYGQSGKEVYEMVKNGTVAYEDLTSAQMRLYNAYEDVTVLEETKVKDAHAATMEALDRQVAAIGENKSTWEDWVKSFELAADSGSLSSEELADAYEKAFAEADKSGRKYLQENIPQYIQDLANVEHYKGAFDTLKTWLKGVWNGIQRIFSGNKIKIGFEVDEEALKGNYTQPSDADLTKNVFSSYDVGTSYVPNDQLALVHKGEAIIPAKYNQYGKQGTPYSTSSNTELQYAIRDLVTTTQALKNSVDAGINVTGEFRQRGSDLYATVEKIKGRRGANTLSDVSFAR